MKILFVTNMYPSSDDPGFGAFVMHQARELERLGHTVDVLHINGRRSKVNYLKAAFTVFRKTKKERYDLVHAHYGLSALPALFRSKTPLVTTFHGSDVLEGVIEPLISRFAAICSDAVVTVSKTMAEKLSKTAGVPDPVVIPCGVDLERFTPGSKRDARQRLGLPPDRKLVLFPFDPKRKLKRYGLAKAAVDELKACGMDVELLVVHGVPNELMPLYYAASDVLIVCSRHEGSPASVKEALACNLPVVSTDVGDVQEIMSGIPGTMICDKRELAGGLLMTLGYCDENRFNGRAQMSRYDQGKTVAALTALYDRTIQKKMPVGEQVKPSRHFPDGVL